MPVPVRVTVVEESVINTSGFHGSLLGFNEPHRKGEGDGLASGPRTS